MRQIYSFLNFDLPGTDYQRTRVCGNARLLGELLAEKPEQYVVMVSGHGTVDNVRRVLGMGAKGFIVKPYTMGRVKDMLVKYIRDNGLTDHIHDDEKPDSN